MKKSLLLVVLIFFGVFVFAQEEKATDNVKTGWNFGALPTITYNTDLGFQYGALVDLYHYGDGSVYPNYLHNFYFEVSRFTKGSGINRITYDSKYLIPGIRVTSDLAYLPDDAYDFYGFNGFQSVFNSDWQETYLLDSKGKVVRDENDHKVLNPEYRTRMFYKHQYKTFKFKTDFQIPINDKLLGLVGFNMMKFTVDQVNIDKFNKGNDGSDPDKLPPLPANTKTLYDEYVDWGIISEEEADGGFVPLFKVGVVYDTRDNEANPMKGMWTEAFVFGAPEFLGAESGFAKFNITHRQYFTLVKRDLGVAYRLGYQGTIAGHTPFYYQTQIETSSKNDLKGLGGSKTIRGINRNRVVGDGIAYGNIELRWKAVHFNWISQHFYIGLNGFTDFGMVVQPIENDALTALVNSGAYTDYFSSEGEKLHMSFGAGLRIVMNENFVIACDWGKAANPQDGSTGLYIGLNYLF